MKIVFLSCYSGVVFRGAETVCDSLAKCMAQRHDVTVFQPKKFEIDRPYRIVEIPVVVGESKASRSALKYVRLDRAYRNMLLFAVRSIWKCVFLRPDVIVPMNGNWVTFLAKIYSALSGAHLIVSGQSAACPDSFTLKMRPSLFVCLSKLTERHVKKLAPRQKTAIIPNGVDLNRFAPGPKTNPFGLPRPVVLCAAGPDRYKNVPETIQAVARLEGVSLLVMGGNPDTLELGTRLLGARFRQATATHDQMPAIFNSADLFTLVSESSEAFGVVYLEAMACNLPVVATDDELRRGIVSDAGAYVAHPKDIADYAAVLQRALAENWEDRPRRQAARFDWEKISLQYEAEFANLKW
jgi:glycosyltransferase involved in cell wall biosynthesis